MSSDPFQAVALAPPDSIFQLTASFKADTFKDKVNLGVGAYRDNAGKPYVLPSVKKAKKALADSDETIDHEYLPITGLTTYTGVAAALVLGENSPAIKEGRVSTVQTISGTGANHLGGLFLSKFYGPWEGKSKADKPIYISNPTWANHNAIFNLCGLTPTSYPYYDPATIGFSFEKFLGFLSSLPPSSVILLHACAHNPTGIDPTSEEWKQIAAVFKEKGHFAFFDSAYQGFASGDLEKDAEAVRLFVAEGIPLLICQSFAKNAGLYGERVGALHVVSKHAGEVEGGAKRVLSQLSVLQRSEISNPPTFGARIVSLLLNDPKLFGEWKEDIKTMSYRIIDMRKALRSLLEDKYQTPNPVDGSKKNKGAWQHVTDQIGMFSFTGLGPEHCKALIATHHIYLTANGRISMAGLNESNVDYVAKSIDAVVRG